MNSTPKTQLAIIGAGPGGYTAAFLAADKGYDVTLIDERGRVGGTCLFEGCIPSKALLHAAQVLRQAEEAKALGINFSAPSVDIEKLRGFKDRVIDKLALGLDHLAKQRKITVVHGQASFADNHHLKIVGASGTTTLEFSQCLIAVGSKPQEIPALAFDQKNILSSKQALELSEIPETLGIIGGGYIGLELASFYAATGSRVTVIEMMPTLLSTMDSDLASVLVKSLRGKITIKTETTVQSHHLTADGLELTLENKTGSTEKMSFCKVIVAVGRKPDTEPLALGHTKVQVDAKGFIRVDKNFRTAEPNIFAVGDAIGGALLAHKAADEACRVAAILIRSKPHAPSVVPSVVYTLPEVAWCGLTEGEAKIKKMNVRVEKYSWQANGRALTTNSPGGLTKLVLDAKTGQVLGAGLVGEEAGELLSGLIPLVHAKTRAKDIASLIYPHPTLSETIKEGCLNFLGENPHALKRQGPQA